MKLIQPKARLGITALTLLAVLFWQMVAGAQSPGTVPAPAGPTSPPMLDAPQSVSAERAWAEAVRVRIQFGQRLEFTEVPVLDPVIFTEITPYAVDPEPVRLPDEQRWE